MTLTQKFQDRFRSTSACTEADSADAGRIVTKSPLLATGNRGRQHPTLWITSRLLDQQPHHDKAGDSKGQRHTK